MTQRFPLVPAVFTVAISLATSSPVLAQDHDMHAGHNMDMPAMVGDSLVWRMPPMDMSMPMMPGMDTQEPIVAPFLPAAGMDVSMFPEARPFEIMDVEDGAMVHLEAGLVRRTIGDQTFVMMGYNGQYPGPVLRVKKNARVTVHFVNNIQMPTTVHWHGLRLDDYRFDGIPGISQPPVESGESFQYELNFPDEGLYWYHPHMREDVQQDLGLYGNMLVDPIEDDYYAPVNREVTLVLDDILMDSQGIIPYGDSAPTHALMGRFGNVMLVNGVTNYEMTVKKGEVVRFFLTNVANSRSFNVVFGGAPIKVVASDVSKYEREMPTGSVVISPAERYIVDVLFEDAGPVTVTNAVQAIDHFRGEFYPDVRTLAVINVEDGTPETDFSQEFREFRTNEDVIADIDAFRPFFDKEPDHRLELTVRVNNLPLPIMMMMEVDTLYVPPMEWNDAMPMMNWVSTGEQVEWILHDVDTGKESMEIDWSFKKDDVVKIRVFNSPRSFHPMNHPFHIHGQRFLVTHIDGVPNPNLVWKDTAIVPVGSTVDFLVHMSNPGKWMAHCHIAEHLHSGMMLPFEVTE
ncbi:MAG: multicopper oxidase family protein [Rhodothermales bacterium]